jgi:hypothetical protein
MDKTYISVPEPIIDYMEGLWYLADGCKQLIRFLSSRDRNDHMNEYIKEQRDLCLELHTKYNMALNEAIRAYAFDAHKKGYLIAPNFAMGVFEAVKPTGGTTDV